MRQKTIVEPTGVQKGDEWLSPDGHSSTWRRVWNGTAWVEDLETAGFPLMTNLSPTPSAEDLSNVGIDPPESKFNPDSLEKIEIEINDDKKPRILESLSKEEMEDTEEEEELTEDETDEQSVQTEISDRDGTDQGAGGKPEPETKQRGQRGKVRKGRKGK